MRGKPVMLSLHRFDPGNISRPRVIAALETDIQGSTADDALDQTSTSRLCLPSLSGASIGSGGGMGVRHERGDAKIDHLVKDWLRLLLIFHHQAWMTEANARGVDKACRERRVSRMELACRHATRDYLFKNPGHALVVLAHDRPVFSYRGCDQFVQLAVGHIQFGACLFDGSD
jgi:hypothetical protein